MSQDFEDRDPFVGRPLCWLVGVRLGPQPMFEVEDHLDELAGLVQAAGGQVVGRSIQSRAKPDPGAFIGRGKAEEIGQEIKDWANADNAKDDNAKDDSTPDDQGNGERGVELVLFDEDLTASQVQTLEKLLGVAVMDRSGVILEIFHQRARTSEARTQVELARLRYLLPRLTRRWGHLSRQQGGIGVRGGEGETQLEADRRMLRTRIARLERDLVRIEKTRRLQRKGRKAVREVALAGYTNAGKSTLFNQLTGADAFVKNQVFATLDSKLRRGHLVAGKVAVFADTVGFIRKLPHHLVASFRSTLGEVVDADLVLHVVDRSHPAWEEQQAVAKDVLQDLEVDPEKVVLVHNKIDRLHGAVLPGANGPRGSEVYGVSATTGAGLDELCRHLAHRLYGLDQDASEDELWLQAATV